MTRLGRALSGVAVLAMTLQARAADAPLSVALPAQETVSFHGIANLDSAGTGTLGMMYPAPNAAGFLAAVLTHGLVAESAKNAQKAQMQLSADKVLEPYRQALQKMRYGDIGRNAVSRLGWKGEVDVVSSPLSPVVGWRVDTAPTFFMTPDQRALVLDAEVKVSPPGASASETIAVRVVSKAQQAQDIVAYWLDNEGQALADESADLLAKALRLALDAKTYAAAPETPRTVRFLQGASEYVERATVLARHCDRQILRNLRGRLLSVPLMQELSTCESTGVGQR